MIKKLAVIEILTIVIILSLTYVGVSPKIKTSLTEDFVVVIDPGHGGVDPGVISSCNGVKESDLNLYLSDSLYKRFLADGNSAIMTRTCDCGLYGSLTKGFKKRDLQKRVEICNRANADIFISIHMNKYSDKTRRGAQVFYNPQSKEGKIMAGYIQDQLNGLSESVRICTPLAGDYYLLNNVDCTAVIVECGFLSNYEDEALLLSESYREKVAHSIFYGVKNYLNNLEN